jgi:uncharacterized membrane protein YgcG
MTIKKNLLMITAAAFISTGAAFAQEATSSAPATKPSIDFLLALFAGETAPTVDEIIAAIELAGYEPGRVYVDGDGEVRVRFVVDGVEYRVRIDGDEVRYKRSDDGLNDTSDANGDDTSDTSDSNGGSSNSSSDSNSGSDDNSGSDSNSGSGGSSDN